MLVYIGIYTAGASEGIYLYRLDMATGALQLEGTVPDTNPSFLTIHPNGRYLYAVNEGEAGAVTAYAIDPDTCRLTRMNRQPSHGASPCHISITGDGQYAMVANYRGGTVTVLPIGADGTLGEATDSVQHQGASGANPQRQEAPHPHSVWQEPSGALILVPDLGLDRIMAYRLDPDRGKLVPAETPYMQVRPGAGPRHMAFHPAGPFAYMISELDSCVTAYRCDPAGGSLTELQTVPALPSGFSGTSWGADIHLHPSGRFLYGSNRGDDSLVVYAVDPETGRLTYVEHQSTRGSWPRGIALDPSGTFLLAANQKGDTVTTFRIDPQTGRLSFTGHVVEVPAPVCVKLLQA